MIGLYVPDMWSVLCVPYLGGGILYSNDHKDYTYRTSGQCCVFCMLVVVSNIVIGLYVPDMWSVLCVLYVGGGI